MYLILASIVAAAVISVMLLKYGHDGYEGRHLWAVVAGVFLGLGATIGAVVYAIAVWGWIGADDNAQLIDHQYGTNRTQAMVPARERRH